MLEQPQALESSPMSNSSLLSTKLQLSPLCASIPNSNSHSSEPNIPSSSISNPSSETRKVQVYTRRKRQFQGENETLACLTLVQEFESNPMTAGTSTGGKNELEQKGSEEIQTIDDLELPIALRKGTQTCTQHPIRNFISYATSLSLIELSSQGWIIFKFQQTFKRL